MWGESWKEKNHKKTGTMAQERRKTSGPWAILQRSLENKEKRRKRLLGGVNDLREEI